MQTEISTFSNTINQDLVGSDQPLKLVIPRSFLWGSQPREHYCHSSRRRVCQQLKQFGTEFLIQNPPIVFAQAESNCSRIVIFDGHHRVRNAPRFGITKIPCLVYDPKQLFDHNKKNYPEEFTSDMNTFLGVLEKRITWTLESFRNLPDNKQPSFITGIHSINQLKERFPSF